jgi:curved DNA-binding protein CbpA
VNAAAPPRPRRGSARQRARGPAGPTTRLGTFVGRAAQVALAVTTEIDDGVEDVEDPYEVLGVTRDADPATVTAAYRRLVREHHPDIHVGDGPDERAARHRRMASINAAYRILNDPRELDRFLKLQQRRNGASASPSDRDDVWFTASPPSPSGSQQPSATHGFDYRQRAPSEFDVRREPAEERATRKAQRRFGRRRRRT